jgi:hypothetical protein
MIFLLIFSCSPQLDEDKEFSISYFDILFVVDNSPSMLDESIMISSGLPKLLDNLGWEFDTQFAVTTTSVDSYLGLTTEVDPGEAGLLLGEESIIQWDDPEVSQKFKKTIVCEGIYWEYDSLPIDENYVCDSEEPQIDFESPTVEELDCYCGDMVWYNRAGSGNEEPLEAAVLAICRAEEEPPEFCYDPLSVFTENDVSSNDGFIREDSHVVVITIGDEGDYSRRMQQGDGVSGAYEDIFGAFDFPVHSASIGPNYVLETNEFPCNSSGATTWSVERLIRIANGTNGIYRPIVVEEDGGCKAAQLEQYFEDFAEMLHDIRSDNY